MLTLIWLSVSDSARKEREVHGTAESTRKEREVHGTVTHCYQCYLIVKDGVQSIYDMLGMSLNVCDQVK